MWVIVVFVVFSSCDTYINDTVFMFVWFHPNLQGEFILVSDRQSDASFLIHHFLSLYLRGELSPVCVLLDWEKQFMQVWCSLCVLVWTTCLPLFYFSTLQSVVSGSGAVLQSLQCSQSEAGESPLWSSSCCILIKHLQECCWRPHDMKSQHFSSQSV